MTSQTDFPRFRVIKSRLVVHDIGMTQIALIMKRNRQHVSGVLNGRIESENLLDRIEAYLNDRERKVAA